MSKTTPLDEFEKLLVSKDNRIAELESQLNSKTTDKDIIDFETLLKEIQEQKKTIAELELKNKQLIAYLQLCYSRWSDGLYPEFEAEILKIIGDE